MDDLHDNKLQKIILAIYFVDEKDNYHYMALCTNVVEFIVVLSLLNSKSGMSNSIFVILLFCLHKSCK
jgi:hypothetical protein